MPARRIITDFVAVHRTAARNAGLDVADHRGWWRYVQRSFAAGFAQMGLDVSAQWPFAEDGTPLVVEPPVFVAQVNQGRWLTVCDCGGVSLLRRAAEYHVCLACGNDGDDAFRRVVWPAEMDAIERVLLVRPRQVNRNWAEPETLADLIAENVEHGL